MKKDISNAFQTVSGLGPIADDYDALFCDIWGVIHNGRIPFHEACDALERFRQERGPVILISNSPRPSVAIPEQFRQIGVPGELWDAIVTSGDATIDELSRRAPGPAFKLGPERDDGLYAGLEMHFSDIEDAAFISCTGLFEDEHETPDDYTDLLSQAREYGVPMVCANPDIKVRRGNKEIYCGGALAQKYEIWAARLYMQANHISRSTVCAELGSIILWAINCRMIVFCVSAIMFIPISRGLRMRTMIAISFKMGFTAK